MHTQSYRRKPFYIEAVQITTENIEEIAELIGRVMTKEEDGSPFIQIDNVIIPGISRAYPGFWLTIMNDRYRCYSNKIFTSQFEPNPAAAPTADPAQATLPFNGGSADL